MNAVRALNVARAAGIKIALDGDALVLAAGTPPPPAVLELLADHKAGILALLRPVNDRWSGEDWLAFFDERAGIAEFDGGLPRVEAEARALACCVAEWLNRNPMRSPPCHCLVWGEAEHGHEPLLPFGTETTGHSWLHSRCWPDWHETRKAEAVAALAAFGIPEMRTPP